MRVDAAEVRRVRELLGEHQAQFGGHFFVTRRTVIRWEKGGANFRNWGRWDYELGRQTKSDADRWREVVARAEARAKKLPQRKGATAIAPGNGARPPAVGTAPKRRKPGRLRSSGKKKKTRAKAPRGIVSKRRRGVTRRRRRASR